jgi:multidrug transporter EmrE-like cation transporter
MWFIALALGLCSGLFHSFASFHEPLKSCRYYYLIVLGASLCLSLGWATIARSTNVEEEVYKYGSAHDAGIVLLWYVASIFLFKMHFSALEWAGIALVVTGCLILKVAGG